MGNVTSLALPESMRIRSALGWMKSGISVYRPESATSHQRRLLSQVDCFRVPMMNRIEIAVSGRSRRGGGHVRALLRRITRFLHRHLLPADVEP